MRIGTIAGVEYRNKVYFSSVELNGLFCMDMESREVEFLKLFEKEKFIPRLHRAAFLYKNEAWFIPQEAENIARLNLETLTLTYYPFPCHKNNELFRSSPGSYCVYSCGYVFKEKFLCMIPWNIDAALIINMESYEMYPYYDVIDPFEEAMCGAALIGDKLYLFPGKGKNCIEVDLRKDRRNKLEWNYMERAFETVVMHQNKLWFVPKVEKYILSFDIRTGEKQKFEIPCPDDMFSGVICFDCKFIFLPLKARYFMVFDLKDFSMKLELLEENSEIFAEVPMKVSSISSYEKVIIAMGQYGYLVRLEDVLNRFEVIPIQIKWPGFLQTLVEYLTKSRDERNKNEIIAFLHRMDLKNALLYESEDGGIKTIKNLIDIENFMQDTNNNIKPVCSIGKRIWAAMGNE